MIVMTIPKIIPPTNEAPSNFLPPAVGTGVVISLMGAAVDAGGVCIGIRDGVVNGLEVVGDIVVALGAGVVEFDEDLIVSLETAETTN